MTVVSLPRNMEICTIAYIAYLVRQQVSYDAMRALGAAHSEAVVESVLYCASRAQEGCDHETTMLVARCIAEWLTYFVLEPGSGFAEKVMHWLPYTKQGFSTCM